MKFLKFSIVIFLFINLLGLRLVAQENRVGLKSGVGIYNQVIRNFYSEELFKNADNNSNPKYKPKTISGIGYFTSFEYQFKTGFKINIGFDIADLKQYYNDDLGLYWENSYQIKYHVYYISFSKSLNFKRIIITPEAGVVYRNFLEDILTYKYQKFDTESYEIFFPQIINNKSDDIGLKIALDCSYSINKYLNIGLRLSTDIINLRPETIFVTPFISIWI